MSDWMGGACCDRGSLLPRFGDGAEALCREFFWVAVWATVAGGCSGTFTGVVFAEISARVQDHQRGRAVSWVMSGQSLTWWSAYRSPPGSAR
jgi:predicted MFS family arabinose efflux permease